jgi:hypothetical protein
LVLADRALGADFLPKRLHPRVQAGPRQGISLPPAAAGCLLSFSTASGFRSQRRIIFPEAEDLLALLAQQILASGFRLTTGFYDLQFLAP